MYILCSNMCMYRYIQITQLTCAAATFMICLAAKLHIAGTVTIHNILRLGLSKPSNFANVIPFMYASAVANTVVAGSALPLAALIISLDVIFYKTKQQNLNLYVIGSAKTQHKCACFEFLLNDLLSQVYHLA